MTEEEVRKVAAMLVTRHGAGASLMAYLNVTRTMKKRNLDAAKFWCCVLLAIEEMLNQA